jgi:hypothetical protein
MLINLSVKYKRPLQPKSRKSDFQIMTYPQPQFEGHQPARPITFCSCVPFRTELEQTPIKREIAVMWMKDAAAGAGLIIFMVSSFVLAGGAQSVLHAL